MGFTANAVSLIGLLIGVAGCVAIATPNLSLGLAGVLLVNIVALLDCVDGNIARARKETGPAGDWIDAIAGYTVYLLLPIALGIRAGWEDGWHLDGLPVLLGAVASSFNMYTRLVHQKYDSALLKSGVSTSAPASDKPSLMKRVSGALGLCGSLVPALFLVLYFNLEIWYVAFYALVYLLVAVMTTMRRIRIVLRGV